MDYIIEKVLETIVEPIIGTGKKWKKKEEIKIKIQRLGQWIGQFEKGDEFVTDIQVMLSPDNMRSMYDRMENISDFQYMQILRKKFEDLSSQYCPEVQEGFSTKMAELFVFAVGSVDEERAARMIEGDTHSMVENGFSSVSKGVLEISNQVKNLTEERERDKVKEIHYEISESPGSDLKWQLTFLPAEGIFGNDETRKEDLRKLTSHWREERKTYPGWYIMPPRYRVLLQIYTRTEELLQYEKLFSVEQLFDFAFELIWRLEMGLLPVSDFIRKRVLHIWKQAEQKTIWNSDEGRKWKWFFIGQTLLRLDRERLDTESWEMTISVLKKHKDFSEYSHEKVELERIKQNMFQMRLTESLQRLQKMSADKLSYELRLQICGCYIDFGDCETAYRLLNELERDMREELPLFCEEKDRAEALQSSEVKRLSVFACVLQAKAYTGRALSQCDASASEEEWKRLYKERKGLSDFFWIETEKDRLTDSLLNWEEHRKQEKVFELHRESFTIASTSNDCPEAYSFYRVMEKTGMPLRMGSFALVPHEKSFLESFLQDGGHLAWYIILRTCDVKNVKLCVSRKFLSSNLNVENERMFDYMYDALDNNAEVLGNYVAGFDGNIYTGIAANGLEALKRLSSVATRAQQKKLVLLIQKLIKYSSIKQYREMDWFLRYTISAMHEKIKAGLLDVFLDCAVSRRAVKAEGDVLLDPFDVISSRELAVPFYRASEVSSELVERMLSRPCPSILRLGCLYEWGKLNGDQSRRFASLIWDTVEEDDYLPDIGAYYAVVFLKWPSPEGVNPAERVKKYLSPGVWKENLLKQKLSSFTYGQLQYFNEIIRINCSKENFWTPGEIEQILHLAAEYWEDNRKQIEEEEAVYLHGIELRERAKTILRLIVSFGRVALSEVASSVKADVERMLHEMKNYEISTLSAEICFLSEDGQQAEAFFERLMTAFYSAKSIDTEDAAIAAEVFISDCIESKLTKNILDELVKLIMARKMPGLNSYLVSMHNILYRDKVSLSKRALRHLDNALQVLEEQTSYDEMEDERDIKKAIELRQRCAEVAFQLYRYERKHYPKTALTSGVLNWNHICCGYNQNVEFNEVRNEWIDGELFTEGN